VMWLEFRRVLFRSTLRYGVCVSNTRSCPRPSSCSSSWKNNHTN